jgi:hypothetical protein
MDERPGATSSIDGRKDRTAPRLSQDTYQEGIWLFQSHHAEREEMFGPLWRLARPEQRRGTGPPVPWDGLTPFTQSVFSSKHARVAQDVARLARLQIGEFRVAAEHALASKPAFLENSTRGRVIGMTQRIEPLDAEIGSDANHAGQRFRRISEVPCVFGQDVACCCTPMRFEREAGAAEQPAPFAARDQVRACRPSVPFGLAEREKCACVGNRPMPGPAEKPGHVWVGGVALKYRLRIGGGWFSENQPYRLNAFRTFFQGTSRLLITER